MILCIVYTQMSIRRPEQHQVMQYILDATIGIDAVDTVMLVEFGSDVFDVKSNSPKFKRFNVSYPFGEWRAGLMRNVAFALLAPKPNDVLVFSDSDVLFTRDALRWAAENLSGDARRLLQFPRTDLDSIVSKQVLAGEVSLDAIGNEIEVCTTIPRPSDATWFDEGCINKGEQALRAEDFFGYDCHIHGWGGYDKDFFEMAKFYKFKIMMYPGRGTFHFFHPVHGPEDSAHNRRNLEYSRQKLRQMKREEIP